MCCKLCYPLWIQRNSQVYGSKNSGIVIKIPMLSETSTKMDWREKNEKKKKQKLVVGDEKRAYSAEQQGLWHTPVLKIFSLLW